MSRKLRAVLRTLYALCTFAIDSSLRTEVKFTQKTHSDGLQGVVVTEYRSSSGCLPPGVIRSARFSQYITPLLRDTEAGTRPS